MSRNNVMKWDELNIIREDARRLFADGRKPDKDKLLDFCDYLDFILCLIYAYGWKDAEEIVGSVPFETGLDDKTVHQMIDGKDFKDRVLETQTAEEVIRIIDLIRSTTMASTPTMTMTRMAAQASSTPVDRAPSLLR